MSLCKNCGSENKDSAAFCKNCGAKIGLPSNNGQLGAGNVYGYMPETNGNAGADRSEEIINKLNSGKKVAVEKSKVAVEVLKKHSGNVGTKLKKAAITLIEKCKSDKRVAIGMGAGVALIILLVVVINIFSYMSKTVNLKGCVAVDVTGYDTMGTAYAYVDEEKFYDALAKAKGIKLDTERYSEKWNEQIEEMSAYQLKNLISLSVDSSANLSNGDEINVTISYDNDIAKKYKIKFVGDTYSYEVNGLAELQDLDPFAGLQVSFEGIAPNAYIEMSYEGTDELLNTDMFSASKSNGINIGDSVTISLDCAEETAQEYGYKLTQLSKTYTCDQVDELISTLSQLSDEALEQMKRDATDCIEAYFAEKYDYISCGDLTYEGGYVLKEKTSSGRDSEGENLLYIIHSAKVSSKEKYDYDDEYNGIKKGTPLFRATTVYMPICFSGVITKADGTVDYMLESSYIYGETDLSCSYSCVPGYTNGFQMYNELVVSKKIDYTCDVSGNLAKFGEGNTDDADDETMEDYILPNSDSVYLNANDLTGLSQEELRLATNELYARHGRRFDDEELQAYFNGKDWYNGTIEPDVFDDSVLNDYEIANRDLLSKYQEDLGYR